MKHPISIVFLGAAAIVFATADAHGWWHDGPDVALRVWGSSAQVDVDPETNATTALQHTLARGKRGTAHFDSSVTYQELGPYDGCSFVGADATATFVAYYPDGSILTGSGSGYVCYDGTVFTGDITGAITGSVGRFEGVTGTFEAEASVVNGAFTGTLTADFD